MNDPRSYPQTRDLRPGDTVRVFRSTYRLGDPLSRGASGSLHRVAPAAERILDNVFWTVVESVEPAPPTSGMRGWKIVNTTDGEVKAPGDGNWIRADRKPIHVVADPHSNGPLFPAF